MNKRESRKQARMIYEKCFGKIPPDHDIHHIDKNSFNNDIKNLICLGHKEHTYLHKGFIIINGEYCKYCTFCKDWFNLSHFCHTRNKISSSGSNFVCRKRKALHARNYYRREQVLKIGKDKREKI